MAETLKAANKAFLDEKYGIFGAAAMATLANLGVSLNILELTTENKVSRLALWALEQRGEEDGTALGKVAMICIVLESLSEEINGQLPEPEKEKVRKLYKTAVDKATEAMGRLDDRGDSIKQMVKEGHANVEDAIPVIESILEDLRKALHDFADDLVAVGKALGRPEQLEKLMRNGAGQPPPTMFS